MTNWHVVGGQANLRVGSLVQSEQALSFPFSSPQSTQESLEQKPLPQAPLPGK